MKEVFCYCGSKAILSSNAKLYKREYGNGKAWICERFPACRGAVGCHPDGRPLGTIADTETKKLRMQVHAFIDPLWMESDNGRSKGRNRGSVYGWLRRIMGSDKHIHVGEMSKEDCIRALELIPKNPYRRSGAAMVILAVMLFSADVHAALTHAQLDILQAKIIQAESSGKARVTGSMRERGAMQICKAKWREFSDYPWADAYDLKKNKIVGRRILEHYNKRYGKKATMKRLAYSFNTGRYCFGELPKWTRKHDNRIYRRIFNGN